MRLQAQIIFVTGTDTGVGKTLLTALLLHHLRRGGSRTLALKPFCSGGRGDAELLWQLQDAEISLDEVNPFYFDEPLAPIVAARKTGRRITLSQVLRRIQSVAERCDFLLIEGSGGILVPLGKGYLVMDLISALDCRVVVVSANRLGTINHTLLTARSLQAADQKWFKIVLMGQARPDRSSETNAQVLGKLLGKRPICVPFLGPQATSVASVKKSYDKVKKTLARVLGP